METLSTVEPSATSLDSISNGELGTIIFSIVFVVIAGLLYLLLCKRNERIRQANRKDTIKYFIVEEMEDEKDALKSQLENRFGCIVIDDHNHYGSDTWASITREQSRDLLLFQISELKKALLLRVNTDSSGAGSETTNYSKVIDISAKTV